MANARYNRMDNQSPAQSQLKANDVNVGRSAFDFSHNHVGQALMGALIPVDCFDVVPNEDIDISMQALLTLRNPTTRQLYNGCRVFFHAYYNRLTDLWEGAKNWLDNGRSGKVNLARPNLIYEIGASGFDPISGGANAWVSANTPMSLLNYLGLPPSFYHPTTHGSVRTKPLFSFGPIANDATHNVSSLPNIQGNNYNNFAATMDANQAITVYGYFPADCAMAYQRNWRDFYANKNLLQDNKSWFPENEDHFILSYSCENAVAVNYENESFSKNGLSAVDRFEAIRDNIYGYDASNQGSSINITKESSNPSTTGYQSSDYIRYANLSGLKFRQFRGDRPTTAFPFPDLIRGDIPSMSFLQDNFVHWVRNSDGGSFALNGKQNSFGSQFNHGQLLFSGNGYDNNSVTFGFASDSSSSVFPSSSDHHDETAGSLSVSSVPITMSDIYTLETLTAFRRRMGMTNGDYNEMIKAQYGVSPNVHDHKGTYIGGYYQDFAFTSVMQTSESTDSSPLGAKAGQGQSSGSGSIGHFHTPDFGWIQIYMSIVPDVYYTQGKPRMFSKRSNMEMYFPLFNNLPAQAIRNDELFITGVPSTNESPFAYEDRYAEYKSAPNRVSGFSSLPVTMAAFDTALIMARRFSSTPALNSQFVTMIPENTDMSVFAVTDEPPFDFLCNFNIRRVAPMPYTAIEGGMSSPSLNLV